MLTKILAVNVVIIVILTLFVKGSDDMQWKSVLPTVAASVLGHAGQAVLGSVFSGGRNFDAHKAQKKAKEFARFQMRENERLQKEFAKHGVKWRVQDAKNAGLHPLAAIGGASYTPSAQSVNAYPAGRKPNPFQGLGQDISRAARAAASKSEREIDNAQVGLLQSQTRYYNALADRAINTDTQEGPGIGGARTWDASARGSSDRLMEIEPSRGEAHKGGIANTGSPFHKFYQDQDRHVRILITEGASEPVESSPYWKYYQALNDGTRHLDHVHHYYTHRTAKAANIRQNLRYIRQQISQTPNIQQPPRGQEWRFDPWSNLFVWGPDSGLTYIYNPPRKGKHVVRKKIHQ